MGAPVALFAATKTIKMKAYIYTTSLLLLLSKRISSESLRPLKREGEECGSCYCPQHFLPETAPLVSTATPAFRARFQMPQAPAGVQALDHQVATAPTLVLSTMIRCAGLTAKPTAMSAFWTWRTAGTDI